MDLLEFSSLRHPDRAMHIQITSIEGTVQMSHWILKFHKRSDVFLYVLVVHEDYIIMTYWNGQRGIILPRLQRRHRVYGNHHSELSPLWSPSVWHTCLLFASKQPTSAMAKEIWNEAEHSIDVSFLSCGCYNFQMMKALLAAVPELHKLRGPFFPPSFFPSFLPSFLSSFSLNTDS